LVSYWMKREGLKEETYSPVTLFACSEQGTFRISVSVVLNCRFCLHLLFQTLLSILLIILPVFISDWLVLYSRLLYHVLLIQYTEPRVRLDLEASRVILEEVIVGDDD